jgi:hypothetical protein
MIFSVTGMVVFLIEQRSLLLMSASKATFALKMDITEHINKETTLQLSIASF